MQPVLYLICGVSGSGKSWAARQVADKFLYIPHDACWRHPTKVPVPGIDPKWEPGAVSTHVEEIIKHSKFADRPMISECPFGERPLRESIEAAGIKVIPIFVIEHPRIVAKRYKDREGKHIPQAALTRASTIINRAREWGAAYGTSAEILAHLRAL